MSSSKGAPDDRPRRYDEAHHPVGGAANSRRGPGRPMRQLGRALVSRPPRHVTPWPGFLAFPRVVDPWIGAIYATSRWSDPLLNPRLGAAIHRVKTNTLPPHPHPNRDLPSPPPPHHPTVNTPSPSAATPPELAGSPQPPSRPTRRRGSRVPFSAECHPRRPVLARQRPPANSVGGVAVAV